MNDFLSNLVTRSKGTKELTQPRVPSLFEPERRVAGQLRLRQERPETNLSERDDSGFTAIPEQPLPPTEMQNRSTAVSTSQSGSRINLRKSIAAPPRSNSLRSLRSRLRDPLASQEATSSEAIASRPVVEPSVQTSRSAVEGDSGSSTLQIMNARPSRHAGSKEILPSTLNLRPRRELNAETHNPEDESEARSHSKGSQTFSASALRSTIRPRTEIASTPSTPAPPDQSSEHSVQITIGRVEVRAIFPEPSVRRTNSQRSRPAVSLDDYLKRNRGKSE